MWLFLLAEVDCSGAEVIPACCLEDGLYSFGMITVWVNALKRRPVFAGRNHE